MPGAKRKPDCFPVQKEQTLIPKLKSDQWSVEPLSVSVRFFCTGRHMLCLTNILLQSYWISKNHIYKILQVHTSYSKPSKPEFMECWLVFVCQNRTLNQPFLRQQIIENSWAAYKSSGLPVLSRASADTLGVDMGCKWCWCWFSRLVDVETFSKESMWGSRGLKGARERLRILRNFEKLHQQKCQRLSWGSIYIPENN